MELSHLIIVTETVMVMLLLGAATVIVYLNRRVGQLQLQIEELKDRLDTVTRDRDGWRDVGERGLRMLQMSHGNMLRARSLIQQS